MNLKSYIKRAIRRCLHIGPEEVEDYRRRGVKIGENVNMFSCDVDYGHGYLIEIGDNCTITHATILTHDASTKMYLGYSKVGRVKIGNNVFIGYGAIIFPGVSIGNDVIVGAGSIVKMDIPDGMVVAGNPAEPICTLDRYIEIHRERMNESPRYEVYWERKTPEDIKRMQEELADGRIGYDL